ncbi:hypothetical protein JCM5350_005739 [Sporobolomyces pararoseus]
MFHRNYPTSYDFDSYSRPSPSSPFSPFFATSPSPSPFYSTQDSFLPPSYDAYDSHRSQLERQLLARKQQERREAEAAAYLARQRQLERQAAIEQAIKEERERRELEEALRYREELVRRAREEEEWKREYIEAIRAREMEARRRRQIQEQEEQQRRKFIEETKKRQSTIPQTRAQLPCSSKEVDVNDLFKLLLESPRAEKEEEKKKQEQPQKQVEPVQSSSSPSPRQVETPDLLRLLFGVPSTSPTPRFPSPSPSPAPQQPSTKKSESVPSIQVTAPSPSPPTPAPTPANKEEAHSSDDEAATTVQRQFRRHLARRNALSKISSLASDFADRQRSFEKPTTFVFQSTPSSSSDSSAPALAFGSANSNFLSYEDFLVNLLSKIDAVESGGDRQVKKERKALVRKVDRELARLDSMRQRAWEEQQSKKLQPVETEKEDEEMKEVEIVESSEEVNPTASSTPSPDDTVVSSTTHAEPESAASVELSSLEPSEEATPDPEVDNLEPLLPEPLESDSEPTPSPQLTKEALSSLAPPTPRDSGEMTSSPSSSPSPNPPASDSGSSTTSSTLTISTEDSPMSDLIEEVLKRAEKLGAEVEKLEAADLKNDKLEESEHKQEEGFVVV